LIVVAMNGPKLVGALLTSECLSEEFLNHMNHL